MLTQNKILQIQKYLQQNENLKELEFNMAGCEIEKFDLLKMLNKKSLQQLEKLWLGLCYNRMTGKILSSVVEFRKLKIFNLYIR